MVRSAACGKAPGILTGGQGLARRCLPFATASADVTVLARGAGRPAAGFKGHGPG